VDNESKDLIQTLLEETFSGVSSEEMPLSAQQSLDKPKISVIPVYPNLDLQVLRFELAGAIIDLPFNYLQFWDDLQEPNALVNIAYEFMLESLNLIGPSVQKAYFYRNGLFFYFIFSNDSSWSPTTSEIDTIIQKNAEYLKAA